MNTTENSWFRVPEVWLMIVLLAAAVAGSLMLAATAVRHNDQLRTAAPHSIASPLPPSAAARASEDATP
jgi:hypothetical protein